MRQFCEIYQDFSQLQQPNSCISTEELATELLSRCAATIDTVAPFKIPKPHCNMSKPAPQINDPV